MTDPSGFFQIPKPDEGKDPYTQDYYDFVDAVDDNVAMRDTLANRPTDPPNRSHFVVDDPTDTANHGKVFVYDDSSGSWSLVDRWVWEIKSERADPKYIGPDEAYGQIIVVNRMSGSGFGEKMNNAIVEARPDDPNNFFQNKSYGRSSILYFPEEDTEDYGTTVEWDTLGATDFYGGHAELSYTGTGSAFRIGNSIKCRFAGLSIREGDTVIYDLDPTSGLVSENTFYQMNARGADDGYLLRGAPGPVEHCTINQSRVNNCSQNGIHITGASTFLIFITDTKISNCDVNGIYLDTNTAGFLANRVSFSGQVAGADIQVAPGDRQYALMDQCWFEGRNEAKIYDEDYEYNDAHERVVHFGNAQKAANDGGVNQRPDFRFRSDGLYRLHGNNFDAVEVEISNPAAEVQGVGSNWLSNSARIVNQDGVRLYDVQQHSTGIRSSNQPIASGVSDVVEYTGTERDHRDELDTTADSDPGTYTPRSPGTFKLAGQVMLAATNMSDGDRFTLKATQAGSPIYQYDKVNHGPHRLPLPLPAWEVEAQEGTSIAIEVENHAGGEREILGTGSDYTSVDFKRHK